MNNQCNKITVLVLAMAYLMLGACSLDKKLYSSGYHIEWNSQKIQTNNHTAVLAAVKANNPKITADPNTDLQTPQISREVFVNQPNTSPASVNSVSDQLNPSGHFVSEVPSKLHARQKRAIAKIVKIKLRNDDDDDDDQVKHKVHFSFSLILSIVLLAIGILALVLGIVALFVVLFLLALLIFLIAQGVF